MDERDLNHIVTDMECCLSDSILEMHLQGPSPAVSPMRGLMVVGLFAWLDTVKGLGQDDYRILMDVNHTDHEPFTWNNWELFRALKRVRNTFAHSLNGEIDDRHLQSLRDIEAKINAKQIEIEYDAHGVHVTNYDLNTEFKSLILELDTNDSPNVIEIVLPRFILDSRFNGEDDKFLILSESHDLEYFEPFSSEETRFLVFQVPSGSSNVEIIGTDIGNPPLKSSMISSSTIPTTTIPTTSVKETPQEKSTQPLPELGIASFVDKSKDPQSYVDRYNKEPEYKKWFDENFPDYTIHGAVGLPEPAREKVPGWIKNNAKWWSDGQIDDDTFVGGIQHLMKEKIIDIPDLPEQASEKARPSFVDKSKDPQSYIDRYENEPEYKAWFDENYPDYTIEEAVGVTAPIPGWIKNTASWWSEGLISEDEFLKDIEFLVEKRILNVN